MSLSHTDPTSDYISIIDIALKVVDFQKEDGACLFFFVRVVLVQGHQEKSRVSGVG